MERSILTPETLPPHSRMRAIRSLEYNQLKRVDLPDGTEVIIFPEFHSRFSEEGLPDVETVMRHSVGGAGGNRPRYAFFRDKDLCVKWGGRTKVDEAFAMQWTKALNDAPLRAVPFPYAVAVKTNILGQRDVFVYMEYKQGHNAEEVWPSLTRNEKRALAMQVGKFFDSLREVVTGSGIDLIQGPNGGPLTDVAFENLGTETPGPFASIRGFSAWLKRQLPRGNNPRRSFPRNGEVIFTHGDLYLSNFLVSKPCGVLPPILLGVVNWENAGFYPDYWEYIKAMAHKADSPEWCYEYLPSIIPPQGDLYRPLLPYSRGPADEQS